MSFWNGMDDAADRLLKLERGLKRPGSLVVREVIRFARDYDTGRTKRWIEGNREVLRGFPEIYRICENIESVIAVKERQDAPEH